MENEKNKTLVAGKPTGDTTESGNFRHNPDGTFAPSEGGESGENKLLAKIPKDFVWDASEYEKNKTQDISSLKKKKRKIEEMSNDELIKEIKSCESFLQTKGMDLSEFGNAFYGDVKLKCAQLRAMKEVLSKVKINVDGMKLIFKKQSKFEEMWRGKGWSAATFPDLSRVINGRVSAAEKIEFNADHHTSYTATFNRTKSGVNLGWWVDCDESKYGGYDSIHELGHVLHLTMMADESFKFASKEEMFDYIENNYKKAVVNELIKEIGDVFEANSIVEMEVSSYGATSSAEWFAETFTSLMGGKPNRSAKALKRFLKEKGYWIGE